jgi:hypothetical protein
MVVLYNQWISENFGMVTAVRSQTMLQSIPTKNKPRNQIQETKNCIYNIPCECRKKYTGHTGRPLNARIQNISAIQKMGEMSNSKVAEQLWDKDHSIKWNKAKIIHNKENSITRYLKETVFTRTEQHGMEHKRTGYQSIQPRCEFHTAPSTNA